MIEFEQTLVEIHCPECYWLHVDQDDLAVTPHLTHFCHNCSNLFKPFNVATIGVDIHEGCAAALVACEAELAKSREQEAQTCSVLDGFVGDVEKLTKRRDELLELCAKLTRETPYPADLDECRSARAALIAEVGTLRRTVLGLEEKVAEQALDLRSYREALDLRS